MESTCKKDLLLQTNIIELTWMYLSHTSDVLGQANIDIPNDAAGFSILSVFWADINGVSF